MKYVFFINPAAGKGSPAVRMIPALERLAAARAADCEIYRTTGAGDAVRHARALCERGGPVRLYACGGDGTLHEVVTGAAGYPNAAVGIIPCGSGNDFVRCFDAPFRDLARQFDAAERPLDLIRLSDGRCCVNMANIGFDCDVAAEMHDFKRLPFVGGSLAYLLAPVHVFAQPMGCRLRFSCDGEDFESDCLLTALGNGRYCGGGFCGVPRALTDDGAMDLSIVRTMSRPRILTILGKYRAGTHLETALGRTHVRYQRCRSLRISADRPFRLCIDGEITVQDEIAFTLVPGATRLLIP